MEINLIELLPIQQKVNQIVIKRLGREISIDEFILAFNVELFEYFNEIGTWKWWKQNHKQNKERILDELADCFAFFLCIVLRSDQIMEAKNEPKMSPRVQQEVQELVDLLMHDQKNDKVEKMKLINSWITMIGCDHETSDRVMTVQRFGVAIFLAMQLFEGITWNEITEAYKQKSKVNIDRQNGGY